MGTTTMTSRERFFVTLHGGEADRTPVFPLLMHFSARHAGISYREFASNGRAMADAQLTVQRRFGLDAITACSDAFRLSADLGGEIFFPESTPPHLVKPLVTDAASVRALGRPDPTAQGSRMADRALGVREMARAGSEAAVLGWVDMPFAEACSACGVTEFMMMMIDEPELAHELLAHLTKCVADFAVAQVEAGADMIGAGDAAASLISDDMYREFALPYEKEIVAAVHAANRPVKLHICGDTRALLADMATTDADLFNVDHLVPLQMARAVYEPAGKGFKGNLNPVAQIMQSTPEAARADAQRCLQEMKGARYMLSAGCEVPADTPDEVFEAFCGAPREG